MKPFVINCRTAKAHAMLDIERLDGEICLDGVTLRRIPYHRLGDVQQELRENYGEFGNWLAQYEAIKEFDCHVRTDMDFEVCSREVHRQFQELLAALRLLRLGGIDFTGLVVKPLSYDDSRVKFKGEFFDPQPRIGGLPDYRLSPADVPKIEELLSLVKKRKLVDQFFFRRFMRSYHQTPEDRIVDSTICLESLLCPKNARKVSYRFRKCGAAILARPYG